MSNNTTNGINSSINATNQTSWTIYHPPQEQKSKEELSVEQSVNAIKDGLEKNLQDNLTKLQATIFELQRISGSSAEFDKGLYQKLSLITESITSLQKSIVLIQDQIAYCIDVLNGLKMSQELTDGFLGYKESSRNLIKTSVVTQQKYTYSTYANFLNPTVTYGFPPGTSHVKKFDTTT